MSTRRLAMAVLALGAVSACFRFPSFAGFADDGAADSGDGSDATDRGSWCALQGPHSLCEDFDDDAGIPGPWDQVQVAGPGTRSIVTNEHVSSARTGPQPDFGPRVHRQPHERHARLLLRQRHVRRPIAGGMRARGEV